MTPIMPQDSISNSNQNIEKINSGSSNTKSANRNNKRNSTSRESTGYSRSTSSSTTTRSSSPKQQKSNKQNQNRQSQQQSKKQINNKQQNQNQKYNNRNNQAQQQSKLDKVGNLIGGIGNVFNGVAQTGLNIYSTIDKGIIERDRNNILRQQIDEERRYKEEMLRREDERIRQQERLKMKELEQQLQQSRESGIVNALTSLTGQAKDLYKEKMSIDSAERIAQMNKEAINDQSRGRILETFASKGGELITNIGSKVADKYTREAKQQKSGFEVLGDIAKTVLSDEQSRPRYDEEEIDE